MKKTIACKPVTELELQFNDGSSLDIRFDAEAISHFNDLDGGLASFIKEESLPERCAKIIYVGAVSKSKDFDIDKARALVSELSPMTITEIILEFNESMWTNSEKMSEFQKNFAAQYIEKIMK